MHLDIVLNLVTIALALAAGIAAIGSGSGPFRKWGTALSAIAVMSGFAVAAITFVRFT